MSASVRLSLKAAKALFELFRGRDIEGADNCAAVTQLASAIAKASRASATRRTLRKPKEAKRKSKRQARQEVRLAVLRRSNGYCEVCGAGQGLHELDHFFGRARAESEATCWLLCFVCHREKTNNKPSAAWWLIVFADHSRKHGYSEAEARARKRLAFVEARGAP